ncbi:hypothetical protein ACIOWE_08530 [Pseudomonas sp. NPDC087598]|uniref:hypothetical protein n=1 Tax=Pseudomonas sp. NPDC087598 TaxID=3364440 RepID=UPI00381ECE19
MFRLLLRNDALFFFLEGACMKRSFYLGAKSKKAVKGEANVFITGLSRFDGNVEIFVTDENEVTVLARQKFDEQRSALLQIDFKYDIASAEHKYEVGGKVSSILYMLVDEAGTKFTPYPAVFGSGSVNVTFDSTIGTFSADFRLKVQNSPTEPELDASGAFENVSGLVHQTK